MTQRDLNYDLSEESHETHTYTYDHLLKGTQTCLYMKKLKPIIPFQKRLKPMPFPQITTPSLKKVKFMTPQIQFELMTCFRLLHFLFLSTKHYHVSTHLSPYKVVKPL